jgi:hypothetical protein
MTHFHPVDGWRWRHRRVTIAPALWLTPLPELGLRQRVGEDNASMSVEESKEEEET